MYLFFDTETTGLPGNWKAPLTDFKMWPRMIQIAWIIADKDGEIHSSGDYYIKPENFLIPVESTKIHGITNESAISLGVSLESVLRIFKERLEKVSLLIGHNIAFDKKIAGAEFLRTQITSNLFEIDEFCTMKASVNICKIKYAGGYRWPSLSELYNKLFNKSIAKVHDARGDVRACFECYFEMKKYLY